MELEVTEGMVDAAAPNAEAIKNARDLLKKRKFLTYCRSDDNSLLFGECAGSGKQPYSVSVDFINPAAPVYRCSCPSRQFPCKHGLALLYAYAAKTPFTEGPVPPDLAEKRAKTVERAAKKKEASATPKTVSKPALSKKIQAQLGGLDVLEKLVESLVRGGLANLNAKTESTIQAQAKQLAATFLPGAQRALTELLVIAHRPGVSQASCHAMLLDQVTRIHAIVRRGRDHLNKRLADPDMALDTQSTMDEWLGHAWQMAELRQAGLVSHDVELLQLSFNAYADNAREEEVDNGVWLNLRTGQIPQTFVYRPFRVSRMIKSDESCFGVMSVKELCTYPGDMNPRVRWEEAILREIRPDDFDQANRHAAPALEPVFKAVKNQLRLPLADKTPVALVRFKRIGRVNGELALEDAAGERLALRHNPWGNEPDTGAVLSMVRGELLEGQAMALRFFHDWETHRLQAEPLSILAPNMLVRLAY